MAQGARNKPAPSQARALVGLGRQSLPIVLERLDFQTRTLNNQLARARKFMALAALELA
jgi:hypothetical protein